MSTTSSHNHTLFLADDQVARRVDSSEFAGALGSQIVIEPGHQAAILENGRVAGVKGPGSYTLESFWDRLQFWRRSVLNVLLLRASPIPLEFSCQKLRTTDPVEVDVATRLAVEIADPALFTPFLTGEQPVLTREDLAQSILPIVLPGLAEGVARLALHDLTTDEGRRNLEAVTSQALRIPLERIGLRFDRVETVAVVHPEFDELRKQREALWLAREERTIDGERERLNQDRRLDEIRHNEEQGELEALAGDVLLDQQTAREARLSRQIELLRLHRAALQADQFDQLGTEEKLRTFLQQRDTERLLADADYEELAATLRDKQADRTSLREHLLRKLDLQQRHDEEALQEELNHHRKVQSLQRELELAAKTQTAEGARRQADLSRQLTEVEHQREVTQLAGQTRREEEERQQLHDDQLRLIRVNGDLDEAAKRDQIRRLDLRFENERQSAQDERTRKMAEWNHQRYLELQRLDEAAKERAANRQEREAQAQREHELTQQRLETERLRAHAGLTGEQLVAVAHPENAVQVANVLNTRATQESQAAQAQAAAASGHAAAFAAELAAAQRETAAAHKGHAETLTRLLEAQLNRPATVLVAPPAQVVPLPFVPVPLQTPPAYAPPAAAPAFTPRVEQCPNCGTQILPSYQKCPRCGLGG